MIMNTIAVISDIHGNLEALLAVLEDIRRHEIQDIICLGDCIGYGPQPEEVIHTLVQNKIPSVMGNHELAVHTPDFINWFNPLAKRSIEITLTLLSESAKKWICGLPLFLTLPPCRFVHGFPPDSAATYLFQVAESRMKATLKNLKERICFIGHTHELSLLTFCETAGEIDRRPLEKGPTFLDPGCRHLINAGSVGQPRDGDPRAKYVIFDPKNHTVILRSVAYDVEATVAKIIAAGLPEAHALKLMG